MNVRKLYTSIWTPLRLGMFTQQYAVPSSHYLRTLKGHVNNLHNETHHALAKIAATNLENKK